MSDDDESSARPPVKPLNADDNPADAEISPPARRGLFAQKPPVGGK